MFKRLIYRSTDRLTGDRAYVFFFSDFLHVTHLARNTRRPHVCFNEFYCCRTFHAYALSAFVSYLFHPLSRSRTFFFFLVTARLKRELNGKRRRRSSSSSRERNPTFFFQPLCCSPRRSKRACIYPSYAYACT